MNEKPKSVWTRPVSGGWRIAGWFIILFTAILVILVCRNLMRAESRSFSDSILPALGLSAGLALLLMGVVWCLRWSRSWRNLRRLLFGVVCLITLIALFYAEENWRGKWAWKNYQRAAEARGEKLDFAAAVPPPVSDEQNFAMQPIWVEQISGTMGMEKAKLWYGESRVAALGHTNFVQPLNLPIELTGRDLVSPNLPISGDWRLAKKTDLKSWQHYYWQLAEKTNYFPVATVPQTPAEDVLLALSRYDGTIEELRRASQLRYARFPLTYTNENKAEILLPHLASLKGLTRMLCLRASAELQADQPDQALADLKLMFRLNAAVQIEPFLISHLVNIAMFEFELQPIWEGLADRKWNDHQLVALHAELTRFDFLADYQQAIRGERASGVDIIDSLRRHPNRIEEYFELTDLDQISKKYLLARLAQIGPSGWFEQNKIALCRFMTDKYLPIVNLKDRTYSVTHAAKSITDLEELASRRTPYNWLFLEFASVFANLPAKFAQGQVVAYKFIQAQATADLARVAIALERYRLAHEEFPETLAALEPQFIAKLPHDVMDGQPLKYRRTTEGSFILYSVGWNETDDGGEVVLRNKVIPVVDQGDWVWRYPTK